MSLIRKPSELEIQPKIKMLIYGQAGLGKSTLALSAPSPLLFDFDGGINRVNYSFIKETVQIQSYSDMIEVLNNEDLSKYETIVIDTGGKCLDKMDELIIANNPKMGKGNGTLTLQGYGERKRMFNALCKQIATKNKHVIFVAHRQSVKDGDDIRYIPLFGGSSYDSLVTELDLVGYMEANGRKRTITFDPTSRSDGKNTCYMPSVVEIPTIIDEAGNVIGNNDFIEKRIIASYIDSIKHRIEEGKKYNKAVDEIKQQISKITDAESANEFVVNIDNFKHVGSSKAMARQLLMGRVKEIGLTLDKESKQYVQDISHSA